MMGACHDGPPARHEERWRVEVLPVYSPERDRERERQRQRQTDRERQTGETDREEEGGGGAERKTERERKWEGGREGGRTTRAVTIASCRCSSEERTRHRIHSSPQDGLDSMVCAAPSSARRRWRVVMSILLQRERLRKIS
jgi:hypothetical protein